jgi:pimeloyl-ACP methyl ester carboxylesterase
MLWLVAATSVTAQPPPAPPLKGGVEESFIVVGITQFNTDTYDVKLKNPRTGYVHSVTIYVDIIINLSLKIGDRVREQRKGGQVILARERGTPSLPPDPQEGASVEPGQPGTPPSWPPVIPPYTGPTLPTQTPPPSQPPGIPPRKPVPEKGKHPLPPLLQGRIKRVCDLKELAGLVFQRYGKESLPIATIQVTNGGGRPTYLLVAQGMEDQSGSQATTLPDVIGTYSNIGLLDAYSQAVVEAVRTLPKASTIILAGHSQGGMAIQNALHDLTREGYHVSNVIAYGAPITTERVRITNAKYLYVRADGDFVGGLDRHPRIDPEEWVRIPGDRSLPSVETGGLIGPAIRSHNIYPTSEALKQFDLLGKRKTFQSPCLVVDMATLQEHAAPNLLGRTFGAPGILPDPCPPVPAKQKRLTLTDRHPEWLRANDGDRNKITEEIGEAGMEDYAKRLGYQPLLPPGAKKVIKGYDGLYWDPTAGVLVVAEAKGGYNGRCPGECLKEGYGHRQGTIGWAQASAVMMTKWLTPTNCEVKRAEQLLTALRGDRIPVRVELFHTEHTEGTPGVTRRYLMDRQP